jgi:thiol:disulfide interchange protein
LVRLASSELVVGGRGRAGSVQLSVTPIVIVLSIVFIALERFLSVVVAAAAVVVVVVVVSLAAAQLARVERRRCGRVIVIIIIVVVVVAAASVAADAPFGAGDCCGRQWRVESEQESSGRRDIWVGCGTAGG